MAEDPPAGDLAGKVAVITGAGSGIGRASAVRFAAAGVRVIGLDRVAFDPAPGTEALIGDAGDDADVARLVQTAVDRHGRLDIAFANAGVSGGMAALFDQSAEDWAAILRVNLIGAHLLVKHAARAMLEARTAGSIILTASVAGLRSGAGSPAYSASKAGVINLAQTAAQQLSTSGIRVNAICPGLIETGMTAMIYDAARDAGKASRIGRLNPLRRGGEPDEIAKAALFLSSDLASYVNGHALVVDGGLSTSHPFTRQELGRTAI